MLLDIVMGLYSYFIHETAIQEAMDKFHNTRYKTNTEDFYQELCRLALRMVHPPDKYTFRTRLLSRLPSSIRRKIVEKGITAEVSTTEAIVKAARIAEDTVVILSRYAKYAHEHLTNHSSRPNCPKWYFKTTRSFNQSKPEKPPYEVPHGQ